MGYIRYTGKWVCWGTALAIQNIPQTQGEGRDYFCPFPFATAPQQSKGSFTIMHTLLGIHSYLELLTFKQYQGPSINVAFESLKFSSMFLNSEDGELFGFLSTMNCKPKWLTSPLGSLFPGETAERIISMLKSLSQIAQSSAGRW